MADLTGSHLQAARRLLEQECESSEPDAWADSAGRVFYILSQQLSPVLGNAGVRALLARCVKLNRRRFPCLAALIVPTEPGDEGLAQAIVAALGTVDGEHGLDAAIALYATFFALLTTFIGERLTWQIVQRAFADNGTASKETE